MVVETASAIVRVREANKRQAGALIALHALAWDVVGVGVPAALAQTWLAGGGPLLVGEAHRRLPRLRGARSSNDESICIIESLHGSLYRLPIYMTVGLTTSCARDVLAKSPRRSCHLDFSTVLFV
jgi:hypothetical protein